MKFIIKSVMILEVTALMSISFISCGKKETSTDASVKSSIIYLEV